jgi:large subunit ribosomal protein L25
MKQRIDLNVEPRTTGKSVSRALRNDRKVPGVIYGALENANVSIYEGDILRYNVRSYENALFNLKSTDKKTDGKVVLIKEVIVHPVTRRPQHVDFFALDLTKAVRVFVEVKLEGKPLGLAEGGLLNVVNRQIEIECLPTDIPDNISADISAMGLGDALHVYDLKVPAGLKIISGTELTIAVVNAQEEETAKPATEAAAAGAAPASGAAAPAAAKDAKAAPAKAPAAGAKDAKAAPKAPAAKK